MDHDRIVETVTRSVARRPEVTALFLGGSHGTGLEDAYSDVDFVLVSEAGASDAVAALWRAAVSEVGEIVLWWDRQMGRPLINAVTRDWDRIDVVILKPDQMGHHRQDALKVLHDPGDLHSGLAAETVPAPPAPARVRYQIEEFIRILGLLPLAVGRAEYLNGVLGVFHLRNLLVDLMTQQTNARHRGGLLHLNRLITPAQKAVLEALPPPIPERDAMIEAHMAYATAYLPLARRLAAEWGVDWPQSFEDATWTHLSRSLGLQSPYDPQG